MLKTLIKKLEAFAQNDFLADSESDSERSGYLSWRGEYHAAAWGVASSVLYIATGEPMILLAGVGWVFTREGDAPGWVPYPKQCTKESLYLIGHAAGVILLHYGYSLL